MNALSGPYAGSDFHITLPYTVFAKLLKPGMKSLFPGEPRQGTGLTGGCRHPMTALWQIRHR
jgi:hypothetical protein